MADGSFRSELFAFADAFIERSAALDPIAATDYGIDRYDDQLTDFSLEHESERSDFLRSSLASLTTLTPGDDIDRIGKEVMVERLTATLGLAESGEHRRTFSVLSSPASQIRQVFAIQPAASPEHAEKIRSRLASVRAALESLARRPGRGLRKRAGAGPPSAARCGRPARHVRPGFVPG